MARSTGIRVRHSRACKTTQGGRCNCKRTYEASVYSKRDGKKIRRSFPTEAAGRGWRTDALKEVKDKRLRAPRSRTLQQEVDEWLAGARAGRILNKRERPYKPAVIRNYELALRLRVLPDLGHRRLDDVDLADLLKLKEKLLGDGHSASTIRNSFVPLQAIYRRARRSAMVAVNPTIDLGLPTAGVRERAATPREAAELLKPLAEFERALWATAFYAGLRRGEMRALRHCDVDLEALAITVKRGWDDVEGPVEPKSRAGTRTVPLPDTLLSFLEPVGRGGTAAPDDLFFGITAATPFEPKNVRRKALAAWAKANKRREQDSEPTLAPITLHEARHSYSTYLDAAGISETRADRYIGHANSGVAGRYRHQLPGQLAEDARKLDAYLSGVAAGNVVPLVLGPRS